MEKKLWTADTGCLSVWKITKKIKHIWKNGNKNAFEKIMCDIVSDRKSDSKTVATAINNVYCITWIVSALISKLFRCELFWIIVKNHKVQEIFCIVFYHFSKMFAFFHPFCVMYSLRFLLPVLITVLIRSCKIFWKFSFYLDKPELSFFICIIDLPHYFVIASNIRDFKKYSMKYLNSVEVSYW